MKFFKIVILIFVLAVSASTAGNNKYGFSLSYLMPTGDMEDYAGNGIGGSFYVQDEIRGVLGYHLEIGYQTYGSVEKEYGFLEKIEDYYYRTITVETERSINILPIRVGLMFHFLDNKSINVYAGLLAGFYIRSVSFSNTFYFDNYTETMYGYSPVLGITLPLNNSGKSRLRLGFAYDSYVGELEGLKPLSFNYFSVKVSVDFGFDLDK
jgi:hypothetical protein